MIDRIVIVNSNLIVITYFDRHSVHIRTDNHTAMQLLKLFMAPNQIMDDEKTCIITSEAS